jgi:type VI secretion system protein VasG
VQRILTHCAVDGGRLARDITLALERLPRGVRGATDLSTTVEDSVERGWVYGSLLFNASRVRTGHLLVGWLKTATLRRAIGAVSPRFLHLDADEIARTLGQITEGSPEADFKGVEGYVSGRETMAASAVGNQGALDRYTIDLTARARGGEVEPIVGRDREIRLMIQVLMRRRQNNPILTGEAGVGKTAIVEGFAQRIATGDVPPALRDVSIRGLDIGLLQAGASLRGEFEARLRQVIDEVQASPTPVVLFIDEAHTLLGAGGPQGTGDAANLLKPALARGGLRTIAATTWSEYKKHIEVDPALNRRFQVVKVGEPSGEAALSMLRHGAPVLERHHRVLLLDEALEAAVNLSQRYLVDRRLPDKAVSLIDTACARVALSQASVPPELEERRRSVEACETELAIIDRERTSGIDVKGRHGTMLDTLSMRRRALGDVERRWRAEKEHVERILNLRAKLEQAPEADAGRDQLLTQLEEQQTCLDNLQADQPLILPAVDYQAVAAVVSDWTGIPATRMARSDIECVLGLASQLGKRVIGQAPALEVISRRIQTSRAGLEDPNKPIGVFLLTGPSGVGKTETALALSEILYGGDHNVITVNMSEFQEAHAVSTLRGAPPGYIGHGQGGVLTEAVRRRPYSVILLDEVEKAHSDVHEIFFQVFDKGWMEDAQGTRIDFRNTLILLTSNVGSDIILERARCAPEQLSAALRPRLLQVFPAALLGRMVVVPYYPLGDATLHEVIALQLERLRVRLFDRYAVPFSYDDSVVGLIRARSTDVESGGRTIDAVLTNTLLPQVSRELLQRTLDGKLLQRVHVSASQGAFAYAFE